MIVHDRASRVNFLAKLFHVGKTAILGFASQNLLRLIKF